MGMSKSVWCLIGFTGLKFVEGEQSFEAMDAEAILCFKVVSNSRTKMLVCSSVLKDGYNIKS